MGKAIDVTIRRWCPECGEFTRSVMHMGEEVCARCPLPEEDEEDDGFWPDPEGDES